MQRLLETVYQYQGKEPPTKLKNNKDTSIVNKERTPEDIKRIIYNLCEHDPQFQKIIPKSEDENNSLIKNFKEELLEDLYKYLEFVLLNLKPNMNVSKSLLQERLAEVTNAKNAKSNKS